MTPTRPKLRFGLWYAFRNPAEWQTSDQALYSEVLDQIAWAETIGYDDVWLTEHHFVDDAHAPSPLVQAAAIAVRTKKIRIGTAVLLLPLYHPVRVAEDGATIDILSGGRFELGVGIGYRVEEFEGLGISRKHRAGRMNEGLEIIRRLWDGETVTFHGKHFQIDNARLAPMPVQRRPPIWVGGFGPAAVARAARLGDGYIGTGPIKPLADGYVAELRALGKDVSKPRLAGGHFWLIVANDPEKTWREIAPHIRYQINLYNEWLGKAGQEGLFPKVPDDAALKASGLLEVLTPEDAVRAIEAYVAEVPIERYYTWTIPPGFPVKRMNEHLELFANKVMPHFR